MAMKDKEETKYYIKNGKYIGYKHTSVQTGEGATWVIESITGEQAGEEEVHKGKKPDVTKIGKNKGS